MGMSDCVKCWSTPCVCGYENSMRTEQAKRELALSGLGFSVPDQLNTKEFLPVAVVLFEFFNSIVPLGVRETSFTWWPGQGSLNIDKVNFPHITFTLAERNMGLIQKLRDELQLPTITADDYPSIVRVKREPKGHIKFSVVKEEQAETQENPLWETGTPITGLVRVNGLKEALGSSNRPLSVNLGNLFASIDLEVVATIVEPIDHLWLVKALNAQCSVNVDPSEVAIDLIRKFPGYRLVRLAAVKNSEHFSGFVDIKIPD